MRRSPRRSSQLFHARFDVTTGHSARRAARKQAAALAAEIEAALQNVASLDEDRILRRFVNAVTSALRTNFYQLDEDGRPQADHRHQVRQPRDRRHAVAAPALRDFRLFAARRGHSPALRQGRARRHPLVGPAAGFPHRNSRPGEGAAGEERGDRAGRRQGRLRAEAAAARVRARRCRPKASPPTRSSSATLLDLTDNLGPNGVVAADGCRASRRRRSLSRGRGRQGHGDVLRHRQRHRAGAWLLARRRVRVGRLGRLRPQEDGHHRARRVGSGEAAFPRDERRYRQRRRSPSSASATCRATCSATACCARTPSSWSRRSITATFSSIPIRIRGKSFAERQRCSSCRGRAGRTTTRR